MATITMPRKVGAARFNHIACSAVYPVGNACADDNSWFDSAVDRNRTVALRAINRQRACRANICP